MTFLLNSEISPAFMQDGRVTHDDREGAPDRTQLDDRRLLSAGGPPHELGPDRLPPAARAARAVDRHVHERPAAVGRLPAGDRDPRGAGPQLPHHPVRRRREGRRRRAGDVQPFDRAVPGRPHRGDVRALGEDHRPGRDRQGRHRRRLPVAVLAAQRRDPGVLRRRGDRSGRRDARTTRWSRSTTRRARAACWPATAACRTSRRRWATSAASSCCSRTCRSWCSAATPKTRGDTAIMHFPDAPVLATLLGANLRQHRNVEAMDRAVALKVYEESPPASQMAPGTFTGTRTSLGQASFEADHSLKVFVPARQAADPRVRRRQRQPGVHDDRGAPGDGRASTSPRGRRARCSTTSAAAATAASAGRSWTSRSAPTR